MARRAPVGMQGSRKRLVNVMFLCQFHYWGVIGVITGCICRPVAAV